MTESEWQTSADLWQMLQYVKPYCGARKLRLLAVACCRCVDPLLRDPDLREALDAAEQHADGQIPDSALQEWSRRAADAVERLNHPLVSPLHMAYSLAENCTRTGPDAGALSGVPGGTSQAVASWSGHSWGTSPWEEVQQEAAKYLRGIVTDVIGNPFWPAVFDPTWLPPAVVLLARAAYDNRTQPAGILEADRLAVLSDALEEAGCTAHNLLTHLRSPGPHVRGCWALDLILGKE